MWIQPRTSSSRLVPYALVVAGSGRQHLLASSQLLARSYSTPDGKDGGSKKGGGLVQSFMRS